MLRIEILDDPGGPYVIASVLIRGIQEGQKQEKEVGSRRQRWESYALKLEEGTVSKGMQVASRSCKGKETFLAKRIPPPRLDFNLIRLIVDFWPPNCKICVVLSPKLVAICDSSNRPLTRGLEREGTVGKGEELLPRILSCSHPGLPGLSASSGMCFFTPSFKAQLKHCFS